MIFDTLKLSKSLRDADFSETQADALAAALSEQASDTLATKADLLHLEMTLGERITELRAEMIAEFAKIRTETTSEFAKIRTEMAQIRTEMAQMRAEMSLMRGETMKWIVTAIGFNFVATAGLFVTFFKLFAK